MAKSGIKKWGMGFISSAYSVALAMLFVLLLRSIAVQITPPPENQVGPYPAVNTVEACEEAGGRWLENAKVVDRERPVAVPLGESSVTGYCQGPLKFERERDQLADDSRQTSLFVFLIGGAIAVAGGALLKKGRVLATGLMIGGIFSFFVAGTQLWVLVPGIGRLITIIVLFVVLMGIGWYIFRDEEE